MIISRSLLSRTKNVSDKSCKENIHTRFMFNIFSPEKRAVYEMWEKYCTPDRPQMTVWRMRIRCWIPKSTNTHSEYVILIAFPRQQWMHDSAPVSVHVLSRRITPPQSHLICILILFSFIETVAMLSVQVFLLNCFMHFSAPSLALQAMTTSSPWNWSSS